jgi:hypothetical protein
MLEALKEHQGFATLLQHVETPEGKYPEIGVAALAADRELISTLTRALDAAVAAPRRPSESQPQSAAANKVWARRSSFGSQRRASGPAKEPGGSPVSAPTATPVAIATHVRRRQTEAGSTRYHALSY